MITWFNGFQLFIILKGGHYEAQVNEQRGKKYIFSQLQSQTLFLQQSLGCIINLLKS